MAFTFLASSMLLLHLFLIPLDGDSQTRAPSASGLEMLCFLTPGLLPQMLRDFDLIPFVGRTRPGCIDAYSQGGEVQFWSDFQGAGTFLGKQTSLFLSSASQ